VDAGQLFVVYQPQVDLSSGRVVGAEALIRWRHPDRGVIFPDEFVALAENTGLVGPITGFVLQAALRTNRRWRELGLDVGVSVNLSVRHLADLTLPEQVAEALDKWEVPAHRLTVEVTETSIMSDPRRAVRVLSQIRAMGVSLAIDDFGTGYSSLSYLRQLDVDELKIDRSFVTHLAGNGSDEIIVRSTVDLGHNLGLRVVAEGVESEDTVARLARLGCDRAQGYFIGRPMSEELMERWLAERANARFQPQTVRTPLAVVGR
jgi:EAL domain-containing protein (putative c-di-GMP-specific phosphodiesterase class I)